MKKIVTSNKNVHGKTIILPVVGELKVSDEGVVEVSDNEIADNLVNNSANWAFFQGEVGSVVKTTEIEPETEGEDVDEDAAAEALKKEVRDKLKDQLSLSEMKEIAAADKNITAGEIKKYSNNKTVMANFLMGKLGVEKISEMLK